MKRPLLLEVLVVCCVAATLSTTLLRASPGSKKKADPIADLRAGIAKNVADAERASRMSASVDEMERLIGEAGALVVKRKAELSPLLRDYRASREAVEAKLAEGNDQRAALARKVLEAHVAFKKETTPDEWKKLAKLEEQALGYAAVSSLGQQPLLAKEN